MTDPPPGECQICGESPGREGALSGRDPLQGLGVLLDRLRPGREEARGRRRRARAPPRTAAPPTPATRSRPTRSPSRRSPRSLSRQSRRRTRPSPNSPGTMSPGLSRDRRRGSPGSSGWPGGEGCGGALAQDHLDDLGVVLAPEDDRGAADVRERAAQVAVERLARRRAELHPAELDDLVRREVGRERLHEVVPDERHPREPVEAHDLVRDRLVTCCWRSPRVRSLSDGLSSFLRTRA